MMSGRVFLVGLTLLLTVFVALPGQGQSETDLAPPPETGAEVDGTEVGELDSAELQDPPRRRRRRGRGGPPAPQPAAPPKEEKTEVKKEPDVWLAVVGGTIHTVTDGRILGGTILVKNGRIHELGSGIPVPAEAEVVDAKGLHVYPGLVAIDSSRLVSTPDNTDVYSGTMELALAGGITTARTRGDIVKLTYGTLDGHALGKTPFANIDLRSVKAKRDLKAALERIREYHRKRSTWEEDKKKDPKAPEPDRKWIRGLFSTAEQLIDGKKVAFATAISARQIREVCELATHYDFELVVNRADEGWIVASDLARANAAAIVTPRTRRDSSTLTDQPTGSSIENARILHDHGVNLAIFPVGSLFSPGGGVSTSGLAGRDMLNLPLEAAFAVRGGLSNDAAVRAITIDAARILRVDDRVGSIEVGKDADFVITDGDLLYYLTQARWTIVNGRIAYDKEKAGILSHIRPQGKDAPPSKDGWPRRLGDPLD